MRLSLPAPWLFALLSSLLLVPWVSAESQTPDIAWPDGTPQQLREDIFGIRFRMKRELDGAKAGLAFLKREYERNPRPEVKAYLGWICIFAQGWGYPEMHDEARGLKLVTEAMNEGSIVARDVLARAKGNKIGGEPDPAEVVRLLREAAAGGATRSMARLAVYSAYGYGTPRNLVEADRWAQRAAELGQPSGLVEIGDAYAGGDITGRRDLAMATSYYYRACYQASDDGRARLDELAKQGSAEAKLRVATALAHNANVAWWIPPSIAKAQIKDVEALAGDDSDALYEVGLAHLEGLYADKNYDLARDCFRRAATRGNSAARFRLYEMKFRGFGEPAQPDAMKEIEAMANLGLPDAAVYAGSMYYWGARDARIKADEAKAFKYSRIAAEHGHPRGLDNLGLCYEHGIGTPENYALAAKVYWQAYLRNVVGSRERVQRLLPFVK